MDYHYIAIQQEYGEGGLKKTDYGIAAVTEADGCIVVLQSITAVTPDKLRIQKLVKLCNELELSMIHLEEVVDDFLTEF